MAMAVGYNVQKAKELMDLIANKYNSLDQIIINEYNGIVTTLRENWVGDDEQSFEANLASKFNKLYVSAYDLVENCCKTIRSTATSWADFQRNNVLDASSTGGSVLSGWGTSFEAELVAPSIEKKENICTFEALTLGADVDRGLTATDSAGQIQGRMRTGVDNINAEIQSICSAVNVDSAFYGSQAQTLNEYVDEVQRAIGVVVTAFDDLYDALNILANSQYQGGEGAMDSFVQTQINSVKDDVTNSVAGLSKWN